MICVTFTTVNPERKTEKRERLPCLPSKRLIYLSLKLNVVLIFTFDGKITSDGQMQFNSDISQLARQLMGFLVTQYVSNLLIPVSASSDIHFFEMRNNIYGRG